MTQTQAMERWNAITATRPEPVAPAYTPTLDAMEKLQEHMTAVQGILCNLGITDRMSLTLGDITNLLRMVRGV